MLPQPGTVRAELRADGHCCQPLFVFGLSLQAEIRSISK
jgi:hypothetical protein